MMAAMTNQGAVRMHSNAANVAARVASKYAIVPGSVPSPIKIARSRAMRPSIMLHTENVASDIKSAASFRQISTEKTEGAYWWFLPVDQRDSRSQKKMRSRHLASQEPHKDPCPLWSLAPGTRTPRPTAYWGDTERQLWPSCWQGQRERGGLWTTAGYEITSNLKQRALCLPLNR